MEGIVRPWLLMLLWPIFLLAGCAAVPAAPAPIPPHDAAAPARTETATFALG